MEQNTDKGGFVTNPLTKGPTAAEADVCVVLVHGRGASAGSMLTLAEAFGKPDVHYRAPQAPGYSWYPHSFLAPLAANEPGIGLGMQTIESVVDDLHAQGVPPDRVVLLGFSQGACLVSEFVARHPRRYAGVVALSGGLIGNGQVDDEVAPNDKAFNYQGSLEGTPVILGCSDMDAHIPVERVYQTQRVLTDLGGTVDLRIYPGMGHTVNDDELNAVRSLLDGVSPQ